MTEINVGTLVTVNSLGMENDALFGVPTPEGFCTVVGVDTNAWVEYPIQVKSDDGESQWYTEAMLLPVLPEHLKPMLSESSVKEQSATVEPVIDPYTVKVVHKFIREALLTDSDTDYRLAGIVGFVDGMYASVVTVESE